MDYIELMSCGSLVIDKNTKAKIAKVTTPKIKDQVKIAHVLSASYDMRNAIEGILKTILWFQKLPIQIWSLLRLFLLAEVLLFFDCAFRLVY